MKTNIKKDFIPLSRKKLKKIKDRKVPLLPVAALSLALSLTSIAIVIFLKDYLPPELPLFYGQAKGQEQLGSLIQLTIPGIISLSVTLINLLLVYILNSNLLRQTLILVSFAVSVLSLITVIKITFLVGSI